MSSQWQVRTHRRDVWHVLFGHHHVATISWIADLRHESLVRGRVEQGLRRAHDGAPARTWTARPILTGDQPPVTWDLFHNGRPAGDIQWHHHAGDLATGVARILEGLNWEPDQGRSFTPAEPLCMVTHDGRPMKFAHGTLGAFVLDMCRCPRCAPFADIPATRRDRVA